MSQQNNAPSRQDQSADALAALASGKSVTPQPTAPAAQPAPAPARRPGEARVARAAAVKRQASKAQAHQFKNFMIPCLLVGAGLLLIFGIVALVQLPTEEEALAIGDSILTKVWFKVLIGVAFVLAAVLIASAVVFWLDVKAHNRKAEAKAAAAPGGTAPQ